MDQRAIKEYIRALEHMTGFLRSLLEEEKKITETDFDFLEINNPNREIKIKGEVRHLIQKVENNSISQSDFSEMSQMYSE